MSSRGGRREGAGRKKLGVCKSKRIRISSQLFERWKDLKSIRKARSDEELVCYLLDLASDTDLSSSSSVGPMMSTPVRRGGSRGFRASLRSQSQEIHSSPNVSGIQPLLVNETTVTTRSILSETLPTLRGNPFMNEDDDEDADKTYLPMSDSESETDSDLSSNGDSTDLNRALVHLNSSGSEELSSGSDDEPTESCQSDTADSGNECEPIPQSVYTAQAPTGALISDPKVVVSIPQLMQLVPRVCVMTECSKPVTTWNEYKGCGVLINMSCSAGHRYVWSSSPQHVDSRGRAVYSNNLLFSCACILSGNSYSKLRLMFKFMGMKMISDAMHYRYQNAFVIQPIKNFYEEHQKEVLSRVTGSDLILAGDGRCDSPGFSAMFCTYSLMDTATNLILHAENLKRSDVGYKSPNMEAEGMRKALNYLEGKVNIAEVVTDASKTVTSLLANDFPQIYHSLDVWHKSKKLKKALLEASKSKGKEKIGMWADHIVNHFWYCCKSCNESAESLKTKWISILHHVCNEHEWETGECDHETLVDEHQLPFFNNKDKDFEALQKVILNDKWLQTLHYYVRFRHTGLLEVYHNTILAYAPKRLSFSEETYNVKILLAIMDHNSHINRGYRQGANEKPGQYARRFRRRSNRWDVVRVKEKKEYVYIPELLAMIFRHREELGPPLRRIARKRRSGSSIITPLSPPDTDNIVSSKKSRFIS